ncbi:MAG: pyridoxamine 5'-phosphate oxidase family protein [Rhodospirillales bacterium]|nr:pyridoxamine 5'-phosphate oxidase family protein [Rhodospirillales bacterium]
MAYGFLDVLMTPGIKAAQAAMGVAERWENFQGHREFDRFGPDEKDFIETRDSFYMATVGENGWPYVQHRGGWPGFLKVLDEKRLGFADYRGNLQYLSLGNLGANDKVALILMDYPRRARMKILAHAETATAEERPAFAELLTRPGYKAKIEHVVTLNLVAFDWNCQQHITQRFSEAEIAPVIAGLTQRIGALEAELAALRAQVGQAEVLSPDPESPK